MGGVPCEVLRIEGGVKRARASAEPAAIPTIMGRVAVDPDDLDEVKAALELTTVGIEAWIVGMSDDQLMAMDALVDKYHTIGGSDTAVRAFADLLPEIIGLQGHIERIGTAKAFALGVFKQEFLNYITEGGVKKPIKFRDAVKRVTGRASLTAGVAAMRI